MALISRKPTSPGRRLQTASDFAEITRSEPEKSLLQAPEEVRGPEQRTAGSPPVPPGRGAQAALPAHRFQAQQAGGAGQGGHHRIRPQPHDPHCPAALRGRREALHPGAPGPEGGRHGGVAAPRRTSSRATRLPLAEHSHRHPGAQRGDEAGEGRADGPGRGCICPVDGQGREAGPPEAALGRSADGAGGLPGHHRPAQQRGTGKRLVWARPGANAGWENGPMSGAWP